jgi:outer membrane protein insertion porin family
LLLWLASGCKTANYPVGKPYIYKTKINIVGNYSGAEKRRLEKQLEKQLDDSLQVSREQKKALRFIPYVQKTYHEFEPGSIARTINFFKYAYIANGYFRGGITTYQIDTLNKNTGRLAVTFNARPYKNHRIDTVVYDIKQPHLQQLAMAEMNKSLIRKGDLYSQDLLNSERNRLVNIYRNNGYIKLNKDNFKVIADTLNSSLFVFTTDPFEQANLLEAASKFDENPTTSVTYELTPQTDSNRLKQYYVGHIYIYPDNTDADTIPPYREEINNNISKIFFKDYYKNKIFPGQIFLKKGELYRQTDYDKTYNTLNYLGAWQQVSILPRDSIRGDTVDFSIYMLPYKKYQGERKLETSINQNNNSDNSRTTNLWGINASQTVKNRNLAREAIQTTFEARTGVELGGKDPDDPANKKGLLFNSGEFSLTYDMLFPKFIPRFINDATVPKTLLSVNSKYTQRFKFFELAEVNLGHSYLWKSKKDYNWSLSFLNFERKFLKRTDSLQRQIDTIPILAFIFNDGMILGQKLAVSRVIPGKTSNITGSVRFGLEASGFPYSFIRFKEFNNNLFSFVKLEADRRWNIENGKTSFAFRTYLGLGKSYYEQFDQNTHLPFFKQFTAGGPNSMRAWTVRSLNSYSTRTKSTKQRDFYGDIMAEANAEFRFQIGKVLSFPVKSALFLDMGNIWNWKAYDATLIPPGMSTLTQVYNDVAIAGGTSLRVDLEYFLIRLDFGLKLKTPLDISGKGGWFYKEDLNFKEGIFEPIKIQLGINYPF